MMGMAMSHELKRESGHMRPACDRKLLTYDSPFAIREAYVRLRTNLMFCVNGDGDPCTTFLVTSGSPSEGKSLTAANTAISFAMLGKKTLLVDADVRKPSQQRLWAGRNTSTGLCKYLVGLGELGLASIEGIPLDIAFCGVIPPNPSELLSSTRMKRFLEASRKAYDYVIVDTAPINTVADAQILSPLVDGVILVALSQKSTRGELNAAIDSVSRAGGNLCGVVINGMDMKATKYSYRYKYEDKYGGAKDYGYGYGYGYGNSGHRRQARGRSGQS
ncbi:capsular biosynthesis protein [Olsenella sp. AM30-3LB]|jgi:capsular exopolysaccharide synthesis family protein|nr:capsular biosynthesis protein [Olsenella sp. AF21-51]RHD71247.1 capsular biosynthesis protein [Olsenella sp. AM30-3LB]